MFVEMIDHKDGWVILINRERILKVTKAFNHVRLFYGENQYYSVRNTLEEVKRILNGE